MKLNAILILLTLVLGTACSTLDTKQETIRKSQERMQTTIEGMQEPGEGTVIKKREATERDVENPINEELIKQPGDPSAEPLQDIKE